MSSGKARIEVSVVQGGTTNLVYDTATDPDLSGTGFKFFRAARYLFMQLPNDSGPATYDNISVNWLSGPTHEPEVLVWTGSGADNKWSTGANWSSGNAPAYLDHLAFAGTTRQVNDNDLASAAASSLKLDNGGFQLTGNELKLRDGVTNVGNNVINLPLSFMDSPVKRWNIAAESQLVLANTVTVGVHGWHHFSGGGTVLITNSFKVPTEPYDPVVVIEEGTMVIDGANASFESIGGVRIGSLASATYPATIVVTNGATFRQISTGGNLRVGDSATTNVARLILDNSTLILDGGTLGFTWVTNASGEVVQNGGSASGFILSFNEAGPGTGKYSIKNGTLAPKRIRNQRLGLGTTSIHFDNTTLITGAGVSTDFFSGVGLAEIQAGGLKLEITDNDVTIGQSLSGAGGLTKGGGLSVTLTGVNSYSGNTVVQAGKLVLPTTQTNNAAIQVTAGSSFGVIRTAQHASLSAASLSIADASPTIDMNLGDLANSASPFVNVGTFTASGTVTLNLSGANLISGGTVTLIKFGTLSGSPTFVLGTVPPTLTGRLVVDADSVDLVVESTIAGFRWTGANGSAWDFGTMNWVNTFDNAPITYQDGYNTEFFDGPANTVVDVAAAGTTLKPVALTVSNNVQPYVLVGGAISIPVATKLGTNALVRADGADTIGQINIEDGSLVVSNNLDQTISSVLASTNPAAIFAKDGEAILTVGAGASSFSNSIVVKRGVYKLGANTGLGSTVGSTTVENGAALDVNNFVAPHEPVLVSGGGHLGQGAITDTATGTGVANNLTDVTLLGDTVFGCLSGRWDLRVRAGTGVGPGLRGNGFNLTKVGAGTVSIACQRHDYGTNAVPYWDMNLGDVFIAEGGLTFAESLTLGNPAKIIRVGEGATLGTYDLMVSNPIVRNIILTNATVSSGGANTADTNVFDGTFDVTGTAYLVSYNSTRMVINGNIVGPGRATYVDANGLGMLIFNGTNTAAGGMAVTNGILAGNGTVSGDLVMVGGTLSPGNGVGTFTVGGNAILAGTTTMQLNPGQSPSSDLLAVTGSITGGGVLAITLAPGAATPVGGQTFQLFSKGVTGFTSITLPALPEGSSWDTNSLATTGRISVVGTLVPSIGSVGVSGDQFSFSGTGGTPGATYYIITSADVAAPIPAWTPVVTNVFDPAGAFSFSTNVAPGSAFFRLQIP